MFIKQCIRDELGEVKDNMQQLSSAVVDAMEEQNQVLKTQNEKLTDQRASIDGCKDQTQKLELQMKDFEKELDEMGLR